MIQTDRFCAVIFHVGQRVYWL